MPGSLTHDEIIANGHIAANGHFTVGSCAPHTSFRPCSVWGIFIRKITEFCAHDHGGCSQ